MRALLGADESRRPRPFADVHPAARGSANPARAGSKVPAGEPTIELATFDAQARGLSAGQWAHVFNDRGSFQARVSLTGSVRPGVAVATGIYWNKLSPGRSNVNGTTSSALTDMGGGATFFDNLVEIQSQSATLDD
jgi:anaerobic selenocysteine-containing dehydrogenase